MEFSHGKDFKSYTCFFSDIGDLSEEAIRNSQDLASCFDIVITKTENNFIGILSSKDLRLINEVLSLEKKYDTDKIISMLKEKNLRVKVLEKGFGVRDFKSLVELEYRKKLNDLGFGEYNINFLRDNIVYRVNISSQMGLGKNQIKYEYDALKELEDSGATPKVFSFKKEGKFLKYGSLTMEYVEGRPLDYDRDMKVAARLLSSIHNVKIENSKLIYAEKPFLDMYKEFINMFDYYRKWENKDKNTEQTILEMLDIAKKSGLDEKIENPCIINTELNNRNFIIGDRPTVIDWEKPIIGECEQDLAHFTVPTTTNWKTDKILSEKEIEDFLYEYEKFRHVDRKKYRKYLMFNSLRGITWCAMANVEYSKVRSLSNNDTYDKIKLFLSNDYLKMLKEKFYKIMGWESDKGKQKKINSIGNCCSFYCYLLISSTSQLFY